MDWPTAFGVDSLNLALPSGNGAGPIGILGGGIPQSSAGYSPPSSAINFVTWYPAIFILQHHLLHVVASMYSNLPLLLVRSDLQHEALDTVWMFPTYFCRARAPAVARTGPPPQPPTELSRGRVCVYYLVVVSELRSRLATLAYLD